MQSETAIYVRESLSPCLQGRSSSARWVHLLLSEAGFRLRRCKRNQSFKDPARINACASAKARCCCCCCCSLLLLLLSLSLSSYYKTRVWIVQSNATRSPLLFFFLSFSFFFCSFPSSSLREKSERRGPQDFTAFWRTTSHADQRQLTAFSSVCLVTNLQICMRAYARRFSTSNGCFINLHPICIYLGEMCTCCFFLFFVQFVGRNCLDRSFLSFFLQVSSAVVDWNLIGYKDYLSIKILRKNNNSLLFARRVCHFFKNSWPNHSIPVFWGVKFTKYL